MGGLYSLFYGWGQSFNGEELYFVIVYIRQNGLTNYKLTSLIHGGQQESGYSHQARR